MKLGAQLFTLRKQMTTPEEIEAGLERVAKIGYKCVQVSGIGEIDPQKLRDICDRLGLEIAVTHIPPKEYENGVDKVIEKHDIYGCKYIGLGALPRPSGQNAYDYFDEFVKTFSEYVGAFTKAGKVFTYHNHQFEFEKRDGITLLDRIMDSIPDMMLTLDCYWVNYGGADVCDVIDKYAGRIDCVHLKDYGIIGKEIKMMPVGEGNMNYPKILEHLEKAGVKYALVEQDDCNGEDPFECLERSYNYLKEYFEV